MDEYIVSGGGLDGGDGSGQCRKKRYHRHTAYQIQKLEGLFKEFPHPDEKQRMQLSRELGLAPRQIKFWFQNRRTQMKAQHERADNCALRSENDRIRCENIAIREALKNVICPTCGGPHHGEDSYFDEPKLRMENAHLKEELDRVSSIAAKYMGRPISHLPPVHPIQMSSSDHGFGGPSLHLDLLSGPSLSFQPFPQPLNISEMDKSLMADMASNAMNEFVRLLQDNIELPMWIKSEYKQGRDVLNLDNYQSMFHKASNFKKNPNFSTESSRDTGVVIMNAMALVDMIMDTDKRMDIFPTIVSKARTLEVISPGMMGNKSGILELMYEELQLLSPLVPTRQFFLLRFCQQIEQGSWAIVSVSYDFPQDNQNELQPLCRKLPSGCLIQDLPNGYSKVTWVEHVEIEDRSPTHTLFRDVIQGGHAFGASRWLTTLQRICERFAMASSNSSRDIEGVIPSFEGKRSMMRLSQRMVKSFCESINPSNGHQWTTLSGLSEIEVRASLHKSVDPGQPNGVVLSAATTIWLPISHQTVFNFFRDERTRPQWDVLFNGTAVQEISHIANGSDPGNCISLLRGTNTSQSNMLILQESCIDKSGSVVIYCPIELPNINIVLSGDDPSYIPLLPSGFTILPDGRHDDVASSTSATSAPEGSLITVFYQIIVSSLTTAKLTPESVTTVNNLIGTTVHQIKSALNCNPTTTITTSCTSL